MTETAIAAAMRKAGVATDVAQVEALMREALRGRSPWEALSPFIAALNREKLNIQSVALALLQRGRADMDGKGLPGAGHAPSADKGQQPAALTRQTNADAAGQKNLAGDGQAGFAPASAPNGDGMGQSERAGDGHCPAACPPPPVAGGDQIEGARNGHDGSAPVRTPGHAKRGLEAMKSVQPLMKGWLKTYELPGAPKLADLPCGSVARMTVRMMREAADRGHALWLLTEIERLPAVQAAAIATPELPLGHVLDAASWADLETRFTPERLKAAVADLLKTAGRIAAPDKEISA